MPVVEFASAFQARFVDPALLTQALTHKSYCNEAPDGCAHNERLEFLGDAVIDFLAGEMLYMDYPDLPEGDLTRLRSSLVSEISLAAIGAQLGIGAALYMGKGEEKSGGRTRPSVLCAAVEAVIGALYVDSGMDAARAFCLPLLHSRLAEVHAGALDRDARSRLQEYAQGKIGVTPHYVVVGQSGPDHDREWTVQVWIGETIAGAGVGKTKQAACQAAASVALENFDGLGLSAFSEG